MTPVEIPDGLARFAAGAGDQRREFALDLVEANREAERIGRQYREQPSLDYVTEFAGWVKEQTGVSLTPAEADWLMDFVVAEFTRVKKDRAAAADLPAAASPPNSPSSTA